MSDEKKITPETLAAQLHEAAATARETLGVLDGLMDHFGIPKAAQEVLHDSRRPGSNINPDDAHYLALMITMGFAKDLDGAMEALAKERAEDRIREENRNKERAAHNVPEKVGTGLARYQSDMLGPEGCSFEDMLAFFKLNDPNITIDAAIELNGVEYDWNAEDLKAARQKNIDALRRAATRVSEILQTHGGKLLDINDTFRTEEERAERQRIKDSWGLPDPMFAADEIPLEYVQIRATAATYTLLAGFEEVKRILLQSDPSHLAAERRALRDRDFDERFDFPGASKLDDLGL